MSYEKRQKLSFLVGLVLLIPTYFALMPAMKTEVFLELSALIGGVPALIMLLLCAVVVWYITTEIISSILSRVIKIFR